MSGILQPAEGDFCPCGSTKKWKRCHGIDGVERPPLPEQMGADTVLLALAYNVLAILKRSIESVQLVEEDMEDMFRKRCLLYFAKKMYRITLAGVSLIRLGQTTQAFTLKRDQHYAWVAFHYYLANDRQSILFFASGPLRQRDKAKEIMGFNPEAAADPKRQKQLADLEKMAHFMYEKFPDLKVPKGWSGSTEHPIMRDWKEPDEFAMMETIVATWPEEMAKGGHPIPDEKRNDWCRQQLLAAQFFHSSFPSQDMHATPMGLIGDLNSEDDGDATSLTIDSHDSDGLLYIYLWYPMGVAEKLVDFAGAAGFKNRFTKIHKALEAYRNQVEL